MPLLRSCKHRCFPKPLYDDTIGDLMERIEALLFSYDCSLPFTRLAESHKTRGNRKR
jgi:hypothetical protein